MKAESARANDGGAAADRGLFGRLGREGETAARAAAAGVLGGGRCIVLRRSEAGRSGQGGDCGLKNGRRERGEMVVDGKRGSRRRDEAVSRSESLLRGRRREQFRPAAG